jgi:SPP1 gp7 family putative phage head morphogenesis protein
MAVRLTLPGLSRRSPKTETRSTFFTESVGSIGLDHINLAGDARLGFDPAAELNAFEASEVIYRCVDLIATELAGRDLVLKKTTDGGEEYVEDDPVANLFNKASSDTDNAVAMKRIMWARLEMKGEGFVYMDRGPTGEGDPGDFVVIMDRVVPVFANRALDQDGNPRPLTSREKIAPRLLGYRAYTRWGEVDLLPSEVLWVRYPHFELPWAPMPPGAAARMAAGLDRKAREWQLGELDNGARPSGVMRLGKRSREEAEKIKAKTEAENGGARNAGRILFTYGDDDKPGFDRIGLTPAEMSYLESHRVNGQDIALALGVPIDLIFGQSTFNNQDAAWSRLWSGLLIGKKELVEAEIDRQVFPDVALSAVFDVRTVQALQENIDGLHDRTIKAHEADITTMAEARAKVNLEVFGDERDNMTLSQYREWVKVQYAPPQVSVAAPPADPNAPAPLPTNAQRGIFELPAKTITVSDVANELANVLTSDKPAPNITIDPAAVQRAYDRHEKLLARGIVELAGKQRTMTLRNLEKAQRKAQGSPEHRAKLDPTALFNVVFWVKETVKTLIGRFDDLWTSAASSTADAMGVELTDSFLQRVTTEMQNRLDVLAGQITQTTYDAISEEVLKEGVEEGEGTAQLAERLKERFTDLETWRAELVARTEVVSGHNSASFLTASESNFVKSKSWLPAKDDRVRPTHEKLRGVSVPMRDRFANGLLFPGDPAGLPEETIGCRCVLLYHSEDPA